MDQHSPDILPSVELPSPQPARQSPEASRQSEAYSEQESSRQLEQAPPAVVTNPAANQPLTPVAPMSPTIDPHNAPASGLAGVALTPQIADDTDLIEKEWVDRAKRIVEHTRHDPHLQTKEMNTMKADYLKKRYNKDIKPSE